MQFKVQVFLDGTLIDPSEAHNLIINSNTVSRIVNRAYSRYVTAQSEEASSHPESINADRRDLEAVQKCV